MKKNIYTLLAVLLGLSLTTCKKDAMPDKLTVTTEVKEVTINSVIIEGSYKYSMEITEFEMFYSTTEDMNEAQSVKVTPEGNDFSVELTNLEDNTQYYYNFFFTSEYNSATIEEVLDFKTLEVKKPTLTTNNISNITDTTAECGGNVTDDGGGTVTERGICWSTSHYPSVLNDKTKNGSGTGTFTAMMTNLLPNTKYYVRAYATNEKGTNYGVEKSFTTKDDPIKLPTVITTKTSMITYTTAECGGNVTDDGGGTVTERGICWSTHTFPKIDKSECEYTINGSGTGTFTAMMTNLLPNTKYYVRAYATNEKGTSYGVDKSFTTKDDPIKLPTVITTETSMITETTAECGGNVTDEGGTTVTARGVCWGIFSNPTIDNLYCEKTVDGSGAGSFISDLTNLKGNTTYYVRAYATNEMGTSYGEEFTFTTLQQDEQETTDTIDGYYYVDLGLPSGLKWATCNVGANSPEEYGSYLTYEEALNSTWGGNWRTPTGDELNELLSNCSWTWTTQGGVNGCNVTGVNGNSIFLPAAGSRDGSSHYGVGSIGHYWSSTPDYSTTAYDLYFNSDGQGMSDFYRHYGLSVRLVAE